MGVMPEGIAKGTILAKLDDRYANVSRTELERRLEVLRHLQPYPQDSLVENAEKGKVLTAAEAKHIRKHWFNEYGDGWWQGDIQPVEPILREGLVAAIEAALNDYNTSPPTPRLRPLPIVFYWVCHPGHESRKILENRVERERLAQDGIEVDIGWSDQQVTFIFHTPDVPEDNTPNPDDEPLIVVKRDESSRDVVRVRVKTRRYP